MSYKISLETLLGLVLLCPPAMSPQMPPQPCKLVIKSEPTGARVTINGVIRDKPTDVTFIVSVGTYTVSVGVEGGKPYCAGTPIILKTPGQTAEWLCSGTAWVEQSK